MVSYGYSLRICLTRAIASSTACSGPGHEIGGPGAERGKYERAGNADLHQPCHDRHSARICLIRAIASSTACSGVRSPVATR